ncbi:MAG: DNA polymerase IV, partial [Deltaproteobacteria bacterium]|nr:DNA polymerase IV [Deltaproteobacteria bacterium]
MSDLPPTADTSSTDPSTTEARRSRICCADLDTFFVSVERLLDPSLVGKPVVVGARPGKRGVVTAASYEVRARGVRSGMAISEAVRLAPDAVFLPTRHGVYTPYARRVREVLERYTPIVRTASIDEFFLDFRGCESLYRRPGDVDDDATIERVVREMRERVQIEIGLPMSVGIGVSRTLGKIASGAAKPAGVRMIRPGEETAFLRPLPVRKFPGIGPVTERRLLAARVETLGQLVDLPPGPVRARFGPLLDAVRRQMEGAASAGLAASRPAFLEHDPDGVTVGSISNERTFREDVRDSGSVEKQLAALVERVCWRARKRDIRARTIGLKLRYADFDTRMRSRTIAPTNAEADVLDCVLSLYRSARTRNLPIRLVGVQLSNLVGPDRQLCLPFEPAERPQLGRALDVVRSRYGYDAIHTAHANRRTSWLEPEAHVNDGSRRARSR